MHIPYEYIKGLHINKYDRRGKVLSAVAQETGS